jgi:2-dehydro-3-deoxyphosphogluconate aldolase/(4S)-4-hydroxy-2-oxoglutarate aldolase
VKERHAVEAAIRRHRLIAILRAVPATRIGPLVEALAAGGIRLIEVTFSHPGALEALQALREAAPEGVHVGAGTITSAAQAEAALAGGATYLVTPHLAPEVNSAALQAGVAVISGAFTPTEIAAARAQSSRIVKIFPAIVAGPAYFKALRGPYPDLEAIAVGGIGPTNLADFLRAGAIGAGIGGALTEQDWARPDYARVREVAAELTSLVSASTAKEE